VPEINKPAGETCRLLEVCGYGCQVYAGRPKSCRNYSCAWLEGFGVAGDQAGELGVLIDRRDTQFGVVLVARALRPGVCQERRAVKAMKRMSRSLGVVCLVVSDDIEDNQRVKQIVGDTKVLAAFRLKHPNVKIYKDRAKLKMVT
jgi:hypothetical protein